MKRISTLQTYFFCILLLASCGKDASKSTAPQTKEVAVLTISDAPRFEYGVHVVGSETDHTFTVNNIGSVIATQMTGDFYLALSFNYKGGLYPGTGGTCTDSLNALSSCSIVVTFNPKELGPTEASLIIQYNNGTVATTVNGPALVGQGN